MIGNKERKVETSFLISGLLSSTWRKFGLRYLGHDDFHPRLLELSHAECLSEQYYVEHQIVCCMY